MPTHPTPRPSRLRLVLAQGLLTVLAAALPAQAPDWAADTAAPGLGGRVFSFTTWQGEVYAGGFPFAAPGGEIGCVARWDGTAWQTVGSGVALAGGWLPFSTSTVRAMCEWQGELVVAGTFDSAGGVPANNIARWNGTTWQPLGLGLSVLGGDADVRALAVYNNELYATGTFETADGLVANGIARWNGAQWAACGTGLGAFGPGLVGSGQSLRVVGSELLVGGDFFFADGVPAQCIARWNGTSFAPMGAGFDGAVSAITEYGGQVVVAGTFAFSGSTPVWGTAAWTGSSWQLLGSGGPVPQITSLQVIGNDLYAGGAFAAPGQGIARWNGLAWSGIGGVTGVFSGSIGSVVLALGTHGQNLLVGGEFTRAGQPPSGATAVCSTNVAVFDGASWQPMGSGRGIHGQVFEVLPYGSDWLALGAFEAAGNVATNGLARWDGDRWHRFADCDGSIQDAALWNGNLIVSGAFTAIGGQAITNMARFDGSTWHPFGPALTVGLCSHQGQLHAAGTNALRTWSGVGWVTAASVSGIVDRMHVHTDGNLYFTTWTFNAHRVYRWNGTAAIQVGAPNDFIHCLGSFGSDLVIGGRFTAVSGAPTNLLARWNGSAWSTFGGGVTGYAVNSLCELDGALYVGANGDPRGFLLRWNGLAWQAVPGSLSGVPGCMFADRATSSVHVFGALHFAGGRPIWNYGEWQNRPNWRNRLHGLAGAAGLPLLRATGTLQPASPFTFTTEAEPNHLGLFAFGFARIDLPLFGGVLVPTPDLLLVVLGDTAGASTIAGSWPVGIPGGLPHYAQSWLLDAANPAGFRSSNALQGTTP